MRTSLTNKDCSQPYDICVITAANEHQAQGYREQLRWRIDKGMLPEETEFLVIADPQGKRIGSGGSTVYVLYKLLGHLCRMSDHEKYRSPEEPFKGKRILILHSGGDSRRLPAYSAVGKIFFPLPTSFSPALEQNRATNGFVSLLDLLFNNLMQLPYLSDGQVVVASGDTLLSFDASEVTFGGSGVTGLAYPGPVEVASNHGVYIAPQSSVSGENLREVVDFLQKPTYDDLEKFNGLDAANRALIDTGVMNFAVDAVRVLMVASGISLEDGKAAIAEDSMCENLVNASVQLDIYREIPFAMLGKSGQSDSSISLDLLQQVPFSVYLLPYCEFFHIGTSKQLIQNFHTTNYTASTYGFQNFNKAKVVDKAGLGNAFVYNSLINTTSMKVNGPSVIAGCFLEGEIQLEGENILTGTPKGTGNIKLQKGICIACIPVSNQVEHDGSLLEEKNGWVSIIYGIADDFKKPVEDDSATFLNGRFLSWMEDKGIKPADLWADNEQHELWNAQLFPLSTAPAKSMQIVLSFQSEDSSLVTHYSLLDFRKSPRMSLRQILQSVDYERFLSNCSNLCQKVNLESLGITLAPKSGLSSEEILSWCVGSGDYTTAARMTLDLIERSEDILFQARLYKLLSSILRKAHEREKSLDFRAKVGVEALSAIQKATGRVALESGKKIGNVNVRSASLSGLLEDVAFELVREAIAEGLKSQRPMNPLASRPKIQIRSDEVVWVCVPARLDFAGGWTDTPPYCLEHGGSVLNAAVKLNGQYPIQVIGKIHPKPLIRINSIDLGECIIISETSEMLSYQDPTDWSALPKAAFVVTGIVPEDTRLNLQDIVKKLGGGIDLTLFSAVPAGSGLGSSSILGSAIIACLSKMLGQELSQDELFNRTLYMEQLMTTGGGWQDQIGGVVGGVKLIQTKPGLFQVPRISWTDLRIRPDMAISDRFLLYYTGYRRMARDILRNVVGRYLDRDAAMLQTISQLGAKVAEMKAELDHRNIDAFGEKVAEVWELNKTLDPGTSNEDIESILNRISELIHGAKLLGAGGGGFLFIVAKSVAEVLEVKRRLTNKPPNDRARFFGFSIDQQGLRVNVM